MAANHIAREGWYQVKPMLSSDWGWSETLLGGFDTTFLFLYAIGLFIMGNIEDKLAMRLVMPLGMIGAAIMIFLMALLGFLGTPSIPAFFIFWAINGFCQAVVWPGTVCVIGNWFQAKYAGVVMGTFASSANAGDLIGAGIFAAVALGAGGGWASVVFITSVVMVIAAALFAAFTSEKPTGEYFDIINFDDTGSRHQVLRDPAVDNELQEKDGISFWKAWQIPGVALYAMVYACVKCWNYGMMMWLPYYVSEGLGRPTFDQIVLANEFDFGGVFGGIIAGRIIDRVRLRTIILVPMLIVSIPIFLSFRFITTSTFPIYYGLVPILGFFISGAANLISSLIALDLGKRDDVGEDALSTVTGIIDGTGSFGAGIGQLIIGALSQYLGWDAAFSFLMVVVFIPCILLFPSLMKEFKEYRNVYSSTLGADQEFQRKDSK